MPAPVEAPNTLISNTRIKIIDVVSEGETALFNPISGVSGANPLCAVYFDNIPVMNGDGSVNWNTSGQGFSFKYTSGASGQAPMVGFEKVEAIIPLPFNTRVFNPPANNGYAKSVVASFNTAQYPDAEAIKVTTRFPAVYTVDLSNGNTDGFDISWTVDISLNGGAFVSVGTHSLSDFASSPKCTNPYYNTQIYTLPKTDPAESFYDWKVRVRRTTLNVMSTNTQNDMFVDNMAVVSSNTYSYPKTALVGLELSADQFAGIPSRAYEVKGIKVQVPEGYTPTVYNTDGTITAAVYPTVWNGVFSTTRVWTDNPAWILYDLITNKRYGLGNYIKPEWLDKWTLYQIAQYCDEMVDDGKGNSTTEPRFTCNVAIMEPQDAYTLLNNLVSVFRGMLYWGNGRIFPVGPETRDPVFNFTNSNVVGGVFNYSDTPRNTRSTVCIIKWLDPDNMYRPTPERIEDLDGIGKYGFIEKKIEAFATTSRGQAVRAAKWLLTVEQMLTETIGFQTDLEGLYLRPGDVFNVYDNFRNNQQQGGRIADFNQSYVARDTIVLDRTVTLEAGFTYVLSALVPAVNYATGQSITGSSQVGLIRNSQIETKTVITPAGSTNTITVTGGGFSSSLYRGSVWILNGSGDTVTLFDQATQYKCLITSEPQPGIVEVLGVKYQTGVNYLVNNNYSVDVSPPIEGDTTPPAAPTGVTGVAITGLMTDNTFFRYGYVYWTPSVSTNAAYYDVSGQAPSAAWVSLGNPTTTGLNYIPDVAGTHNFRVAAVNANGYPSAYAQGIYLEPAGNPLGTTAALSGIYISENYDPYYKAGAPLNRYTGYVGIQPVFQWDEALDGIDDTLETPSAQFITGYRIRILKVTDESVVLSSDIIQEGKDNTRYEPSTSLLSQDLTIKHLRAFTLSVDTMDEYGNISSGARLAVNNPHPRAPGGSGFVGYNGGVSYNIIPRREADISGVYLWTNASSSFTPRFDNATLVTSNLAGFVSAPTAGDIYTWFSLVDTAGPSGSIASMGDYNAPIYGPISGNANQAFGAFNLDISQQIADANAEIDNAFGLITGSVTDSLRVISGENAITLQTVQALSGQVTGLPGEANTALNVRVNTAVATSSGALSQQIDAVRANLTTTGITLTSQVGAVSTALTNSGVALGSRIDVVSASVTTTSGALRTSLTASGATLLSAQATADGALSQWITNLGAQTTGVNASVKIGAEAFVTGSVNGLGGVAVARWGFELDANGKVASMKATSSSFPNSQSVITFGNVDLQSDSFVAGSAGWRLTYGGNAEFNNISARGSFTGGVGSTLAVLDPYKLLIGNPSNDRFQVNVGAATVASFYNPSNVLVATFGQINLAGYGGYVDLKNSSATSTITLNGQNGNLNCDVLDVDTTSNFDGAADFNSTVNVDGRADFNGEVVINGNDKLYFWNSTNGTYIYEDNGIHIVGDGSHPVFIDGTDVRLKYGTYTAIGSETLAGYIEILDKDGNTRKLAVIA